MPVKVDDPASKYQWFLSYAIWKKAWGEGPGYLSDEEAEALARELFAGEEARAVSNPIAIALREIRRAELLGVGPPKVGAMLDPRVQEHRLLYQLARCIKKDFNRQAPTGFAEFVDEIRQLIQNLEGDTYKAVRDAWVPLYQDVLVVLQAVLAES